MNKQSFVISCPFDTYSGYGARSRDLIKAIIELDKYDVKLLPQRWGDTPTNFCERSPRMAILMGLFNPTINSKTRYLDANYYPK